MLKQALIFSKDIDSFSDSGESWNENEVTGLLAASQLDADAAALLSIFRVVSGEALPAARLPTFPQVVPSLLVAFAQV